MSRQDEYAKAARPRTRPPTRAQQQKRHIVDIPTSPPRPTLINHIDADPGSGHRIQGPDIQGGEKIQTACGTAFAKAGSRKSPNAVPT